MRGGGGGVLPACPSRIAIGSSIERGGSTIEIGGSIIEREGGVLPACTRRIEIGSSIERGGSIIEIGGSTIERGGGYITCVHEAYCDNISGSIRRGARENPVHGEVSERVFQVY